MNINDKKVLTLDETCEYLGYKKSYMYQLLCAGILPSSKPNGKKVFFDREKLDEWALSNPTKGYAEREIDAATYETTRQERKPSNKLQPASMA